jgi:hypothetical protein
MIWIIFSSLMILETVVHAVLIRKGIDPTPDWRKGGSTFAVAVRFAYWGLTWYFFNRDLSDIDWLLLSLYALGAMFLHLLIFPVLLNMLTYKPLDWLGRGWTDRQLKKLPPIARWFWLACLAAGMIYGYFHPELL